MANVGEKHYPMQYMSVNFSLKRISVYTLLFLGTWLILQSSLTLGLRMSSRRRQPNIAILKHFEPTRKPRLGVDPNWPGNVSYPQPITVIPTAGIKNPVTAPPKDEKQPLTIGIVLPKSNFRKRDYYREILRSIFKFHEENNATYFSKNYDFVKDNVVISYMEASSSPTKILGTLCDEFLRKNVSAILYLFNMETFGRATASVQYFLQLASYVGIPVIAWNADNSGLERRTSSLQLQLAPSIEHQAAAMLSILQRYSWPKFAIVTTQIAGHNDFVQAILDAIQDISQSGSQQEFTLMDTVAVDNAEEDLKRLTSSEARILFLYSTRAEAPKVMRAATKLGLTGKNYLWIVTQSVIQSLKEASKGLPVGMLGVHFGTSDSDMISEIRTAILVFGTGVSNYVEEEMVSKGILPDLTPSISCDSGISRWQGSASFYRYLRDVKIDLKQEKTQPLLEFNPDGTRKFVQLKIMNLRPDDTKQLVWEEIGVWHSGKKDGLEVKDIVWPGYSHVPPNGIPEKFHLKITFMEEPPFINMDNPHPLTGRCDANKGVLCRIATDEMMQGVNVSWAMRNGSYFKCCSGFCIDLLARFSQDLGFSYDFFRVEDGIWGAIVNGKWTGLPGAIINGKADMIMTSIKINSQREEVLDFSIPFLDTGITIVVAKRTGIISPTAFLEPFDTASWMLVSVVAIQVAAFSIFIFEWLSPSGFNMKFHPPSGQRFSLLRTVWFVWAILFQAAVNIDVPRSVTGRVMGSVWAMFALIFLAIYTANLAAFMITREEYHDLSGIEDKKLQNPTSTKPPFRFGTTLHGNTDVLVKKAFPEMHRYMRQFNRSSPMEGVRAVKKGELDAFLYDATVLEYLTGQDDECRLLTVGSWFALTGYGVAFRRKSKYIPLFNEQIMKYHENGYLERLTRFWFTGACQPDQQYKSSSKPLALEQFMSTFFLLGCGVILGIFLLGLEHAYFKYVRFYMTKWKWRNFFSLISMSMGTSILFHERSSSKSGSEKRFQCDNPACDMLLWKVKHDLDFARLRLYYLEKQLVSAGIWKKPKKKFQIEKRPIFPTSTPVTKAPPPCAEAAQKQQKSPAGVISKEALPYTQSGVNKKHEASVPENVLRSEGSGAMREVETRKDATFNTLCPGFEVNLLRRRDMTKDLVSSTEIIRKPLLDQRDTILEVAEKETVL